MTNEALVQAASKELGKQALKTMLFFFVYVPIAVFVAAFILVCLI